MPVTKTILKRVRQQAIIKFVGDGLANVDLNADLKLADETFKGYGLSNVNINSVIWSATDSAANPILIQRNSSNIFVLFGNDNWKFSQQFGFVDTQNNSSNITVSIPSPGGTLILGLTKADGYVIPNDQLYVNR